MNLYDSKNFYKKVNKNFSKNIIMSKFFKNKTLLTLDYDKFINRLESDKQKYAQNIDYYDYLEKIALSSQMMIEEKALDASLDKSKQKEVDLYSFACYKALESEIQYDLAHNGFTYSPFVFEENMKNFSDGVYNAYNLFKENTKPIKQKASKKSNTNSPSL